MCSRCGVPTLYRLNVRRQGGRGEGEKAKCVKQQHEEAKWEVESGDGRSEEKANRVANIGWRI